MKPSRCIGFGVGLFLLGATIRPATAASNDIHAAIESVNDVRSSANAAGRCQVQLTFSGGDVADAFSIYDVRITSAVDDLGHDLRMNPEQENSRRRSFQQNYSGFQPFGFAPQNTHMVEILSPSRDARAIKTLEGEAELLFPTPENGGIVVIKDFLAHPGEAYQDPTLQKLNVTIAYLGKDGTEPSPSVVISSEVSPAAVASNQPPRHLPFARRTFQMREARFSVLDPNHRLVDMAFLDAYGRQASASMGSMGNDTRMYQFRNDIASNVRLYLYLAAPAAIRSVPFKLENIDLP